jgi:hypothetical protein
VLRVHLIASRPRPGAMVTACGREGFKSAQGVCQPDNEWEAMATLGGLVAVDARTFQPDRFACKRCMTRWANGEGV